MSTVTAPVGLATSNAARLKFLRFVLFAAAVGHLVVGLSFWFAPELAVEEILAWGPASGWTTILGSYDLSVAFALLLAFRDPLHNLGIVRFVGFLLVLHAGTHAYYTAFGDSPPRFWFVISYLAATGIVLLWLASAVQKSET
ncbi:MAG TPA: hypothetical protein VE174_13800 [Actinomycetota bacterium]|nr:hypothetical protein [Actinomycetota bacterium]